MKRSYLRASAVGVLALMSGLLALAPGLALAFDGHTSQGQPCWATSGTVGGVFHAAELDCTKDGSSPKPQPTPAPAKPVQAQPPRPVAPVQSQPVQPVQAQPVQPVQAQSVQPIQAQPVQPVQSQEIQPVQSQPVAPAPAPAVPPASDTPLASTSATADPYAARSGVTLAVTAHFDLLRNAVEYNALASGLDPNAYGHFNALQLILEDSADNVLYEQSPGLDASGSFSWPLPAGLGADTYELGLVDVDAQILLADLYFTVSADAATASPTPTAVPAAAGSGSLAGTWDCYGGCPGTIEINDDGTYTSRGQFAGTWSLSGTDVTFTGNLEGFNGGHATLTSKGYIAFDWITPAGHNAFTFVRRH